MPTEYPACREADSGGSNSGVEAPWIEPASRSASEPETASLHKMRTATPPEMLKPETRREAMFTGSGGVLRGERGQRAGKVGLGRLGGPRRRPRVERGKASTESIRCVPGVGESERPVVARKRGNACGAKGPWPCGATSETNVADWRNPTTAESALGESEAAGGHQIARADERPAVSAWRKPDAGNPHVRFDEGEGSRRSLDLASHSVTSLPTLLVPLT